MTSLIDKQNPKVLIFGVGPVGLDAALSAHSRGWNVKAFEKAPRIGGHVIQWGHVRLFTPWSMNVSKNIELFCGLNDQSSIVCPTGSELIDYFEKATAILDTRIVFNTEVLSVSRQGLLKHEEIGTNKRKNAKFRVIIRDVEGVERVEFADIVLDCTGNYCNPCPCGTGGVYALGERNHNVNSKIIRYIPNISVDSNRWTDKKILLLGAGKSAQTVARDLSKIDNMKLTWAIRSQHPTWGAVENDSLPERQALVDSSNRMLSGAVPNVHIVTGVTVDSIYLTNDNKLSVTLIDQYGCHNEAQIFDEVISLTGFVGDSSIYSQLQVHECYATNGPMKLAASLMNSGTGDCLQQKSAGIDSLRNPEPRFFILGIKSYGRNNTFLLRTGYEQVETVFKHLEEEFGSTGSVTTV